MAHDRPKNAVMQNTIPICLSHADTSQVWSHVLITMGFESTCTLCKSLVLLCKYVVSRLQHSVDSLHVDNAKNDIDLLHYVTH